MKGANRFGEVVQVVTTGKIVDHSPLPRQVARRARVALVRALVDQGLVPQHVAQILKTSRKTIYRLLLDDSPAPESLP